jgi:PAS domain S-box-containing protein
VGMGQGSDAQPVVADDSLETAREAARVTALDEAFRQAPSFLAVLRGPQHEFALVNDAYHQLVGHGRDIIGKPVLEALPELRGQGFDTLLDAVLATGTPFVTREIPVRLVRAPGAEPEDRMISLTYMPLIGADGGREGVIAHGSDVTDYVRDRAELERLHRVNDAARRAELEEANRLLAEQASERERSLQQLQQQATLLETQAEELRVTAANLGERTEEADRARDAAETARRAAERAEDGLGIALEAADMGVWQLDVAYDTSPRRSARHDQLFGYDQPQAAWGQEIARRHVLEEDRAIFDAAFEQAGVTGHLAFEVRVRWPDGSVHWMGCRGRFVFDAEGRPVRGAGVNFDVTERRRAEAERERLLDAERAARVEAEEARVTAEAANQAKSQFLTVMSHELRTPLNAVGGYAELLAMGLRGPVTAAQREDLERLQRANRHLIGLIADVLSFARIEGGQLEFHVESFDLADVVADLEGLISPQLRAKGLGFTHDGCARDTPESPHRVHADVEKTRQILANLLTNAIKFTDAGGHVTLACERDTTAEVIRMRVTDTGRGIPDVHLARVFEPFVQVDRHLTHNSQQGVGLGLAISRDLARGMGGDLTVESTVGRGSTFTLTLPSPQ